MMPFHTPDLRITALNIPIGSDFDDFETCTPEKKPAITQNDKNHIYLCPETIQKMLWRFLTEKQIPKKKAGCEFRHNCKNSKTALLKKSLISINIPDKLTFSKTLL